MPRRPFASHGDPRSGSMLQRSLPALRLVVVVALVFSGNIVLTPSALADSVGNLKNAVASLRSGTSCAPLRYNPLVEQVAEIMNRSTDDYMNHSSNHLPLEDPLPGLKDLGYRGTKAVVLRGAQMDEALAIKSVLLEGYAAIPDCSYTDFGADMRQNEPTGYRLASLVLAGA